VGVYDEYEGIQLKIGDCNLDSFRIGDKVPIDDGIYIAYEGAAIVLDGVLITTDLKLFDKWGKMLDPTEFIENRNPVSRVIMEFIENAKDKKSS